MQQRLKWINKIFRLQSVCMCTLHNSGCLSSSDTYMINIRTEGCFMAFNLVFCLPLCICPCRPYRFTIPIINLSGKNRNYFRTLTPIYVSCELFLIVYSTTCVKKILPRNHHEDTGLSRISDVTKYAQLVKSSRVGDWPTSVRFAFRPDRLPIRKASSRRHFIETCSGVNNVALHLGRSAGGGVPGGRNTGMRHVDGVHVRL